MHGLLGGLVFAAIIGGFLLYAQLHLQESSGVIVAVLFFIYFLPALVAEYRHHRQKLAIGILHSCRRLDADRLGNRARVGLHNRCRAAVLTEFEKHLKRNQTT